MKRVVRRRRKYPLKTSVVKLSSSLSSSSKSMKKKKKNIDAVSTRESFEDTRNAIRNFIAEIENKNNVKENINRISSPTSSSPALHSKEKRYSPKKKKHSVLSKFNRAGGENDITSQREEDPSTIREDFLSLQRSQAKEALESYKSRLENDMSREIQTQIDHEDIILKRETDLINTKFENDAFALKQFEQLIEEQIQELEILNRKAREELQELRICKDQCIEACKDRHRSAIEQVKRELQVAMDMRIEEKQAAIQKKLAALMAPSIW